MVHRSAVLAHVSAARGALLVLGHPVLHVEQMAPVGTPLAPGVEAFDYLKKMRIKILYMHILPKTNAKPKHVVFVLVSQ